MVILSVSVADTAHKKTTKQLGDEFENLAWSYLEEQGYQLLMRNYRTPGRGGGEIDLIGKDPNNCVLFVEVRQRSSLSHGGAGASIN